MGCAYNTGLICYIVLLIGTLVILYYKVKRRVVKLSFACLLMILAGYSSYGVIFIRANARPPMCENAPDNIFSLGSYLNREQYGKTPLFYGPAYCSELDREAQGDYLVPIQKEGKAIYRPVADSTKQAYEVVRHDIDYDGRSRETEWHTHNGRESAFLPVLSSKLHVLALFSVELCWTAEQHSGKWGSRTWQLDNRVPLD